MDRSTGTAGTPPVVPAGSVGDELPLVYSLDRRGPNDPRFGSIHVVVGVLLIAFSLGCVAVL